MVPMMICSLSSLAMRGPTNHQVQGCCAVLEGTAVDGGGMAGRQEGRKVGYLNGMTWLLNFNLMTLDMQMRFATPGQRRFALLPHPHPLNVHWISPRHDINNLYVSQRMCCCRFIYGHLPRKERHLNMFSWYPKVRPGIILYLKRCIRWNYYLLI